MSDETCGEDHPDIEGVVCDKPPHPFGAHFNLATLTTWDGIPLPVRTRKAGRVLGIVKAIEADPDNARTGPPTVEPSGAQRRDTGMAQVLSHTAEEYKAAFAARYRALVASGAPFTSEDVTMVVGMPPSHRNAVGAQFSALLRPDLDTGRVLYLGHVSAQRSNQNATKIGQYRGVKD